MKNSCNLPTFLDDYTCESQDFDTSKTDKVDKDQDDDEDDDIDGKKEASTKEHQMLDEKEIDTANQ